MAVAGVAAIALGVPVADVQAHGSADVVAKRPVKKNNFNNGVKFSGTYQTGRRHGRLRLVIKLQYEFEPGRWSTFVDETKRKTDRRDTRVSASARGPCLLGADRYRTVAHGFVLNRDGRKHKRRDVSRPRFISCG